MHNILNLLLIIVSALAPGLVYAHSVGIRAENYASEQNTLNGRIDFSADWASERQVNALPARDLLLSGFWESGELGDRSFDVDRLAFRYATSTDSHFWFGRSLPFYEAQVWAPTWHSAIGSQWSQNQSEPLTPKLAGWVGAGLAWKNAEWNFSIAATPVFLPNFGPRLEFSEIDDVRGSRYARLPPQYVLLNNNLFPIRFRIDTGDIREIVLQHQAIASLSRSGEWGAIGLHAWSAPQTEPSLDTRDSLRVDEDKGSVVAFVQAKPSFPRREFLAGSLRLNIPFLHPETEFLRMSGNRQIISQKISPVKEFTLGWLDTLHGLKPPAGDGTDSPNYAEKLAWLEWKAQWGKIEPSLMLERHFLSEQNGSLAMAKLGYWLSSGLYSFASLNVIVGKNGSYYGAWRSLDSAALGLRYIW